MNYKFGLLVIALFFLGKPAISQRADQWPVFRGDAALRGFSDKKMEFPLELKWTFQTDDAIVAGAVIGNNTIFVSSIGGYVYALDFTGNLIWKFKTENSIEAPALFLDNTVYIGDLSGYLYALEAKTGKEIWRYEAENQIMGSANYFTHSGKTFVVVGSYDYYLHCVDAETGKLVWKYEADNYINGAAAVAGNRALFGGCDGFLHVVNLESGTASAKIEVATYIAGSVAVADNLAYTGDYDGLFSCIDLNNKQIKWQYDNPKSNLPILASPAIFNGKVVIGGQDKYLRCFDNNGKEIWSFNAGGRIDASPVIVGNNVITATMDGWLYALNLSDGTKIWSYEIGSAMSHNPAITNNNLVVGARDSHVYFFGN